MANSHVREEFSKRLRQAFHDNGVDIDSPTRLASDFNDRYLGRRVTQQAVRKWLNGEAIPSQDKILVLADWLHVGAELLRFGKGSSAANIAEQATPLYRGALSDQELIRRYRKLNRSQQQAMAEIITALAAKDRRR
jgi:transcriptional regulator with XRE-family HTH domain